MFIALKISFPDVLRRYTSHNKSSGKSDCEKSMWLWNENEKIREMTTIHASYCSRDTEIFWQLCRVEEKGFRKIRIMKTSTNGWSHILLKFKGWIYRNRNFGFQFLLWWMRTSLGFVVKIWTFNSTNSIFCLVDQFVSFSCSRWWSLSFGRRAKEFGKWTMKNFTRSWARARWSFNSRRKSLMPRRKMLSRNERHRDAMSFIDRILWYHKKNWINLLLSGEKKIAMASSIFITKDPFFYEFLKPTSIFFHFLRHSSLNLKSNFHLHEKLIQLGNGKWWKQEFTLIFNCRRVKRNFSSYSSSFTNSIAISIFTTLYKLNWKFTFPLQNYTPVNRAKNQTLSRFGKSPDGIFFYYYKKDFKEFFICHWNSRETICMGLDSMGHSRATLHNRAKKKSTTRRGKF